MSFSKLSLLTQPAKKIIQEHASIDPWFPVQFSLNVFSGCEYNCHYCRANWRENKKIIYKKNIVELLKREILNLKIKPYTLIGVGGGINETFSFNENKNQKSLEVIECLLSYKLQPIIVTKNVLPLMEFKQKLLKYEKSILPIIVYSHSFLPRSYGEFLEKKVPEIDFNLLNEIKQAGFPLGILFAPIIPTINDQFNEMENCLKNFTAMKVDFFLLNYLDFSGLLHLKTKFNEELFADKKNFIASLSQSKQQYQAYLHPSALSIYKKLIQAQLSLKIPHRLFHQKMNFRDELIAVFYYLYFYKKILNEEASFFYRAAWSIGKTPRDKWELKLKQKKLTNIKGVGRKIAKMTYDMAFKGDFSYLEETIMRVMEGLGPSKNGPTWT